MSHINQEDGLLYPDRDEEYHVHGYVIARIPVDYRTNTDPDSVDFETELSNNIDFFDWDNEFYLDEVQVEIVKREE